MFFCWSDGGEERRSVTRLNTCIGDKELGMLPESETLVKPVPYRGSVLKELLEMEARERDRHKEEEETNVTSDEWNSSAEENKQERKNRRIDEHLLEDLAYHKDHI